MPNFQPGGTNTDTVEMAIPFPTLGLNYPAQDTIGLALLLTNTFNAYEFWPGGAGRLDPSSWGTAVLENTIGLGEMKSEYIEVYPNPSQGRLFIQAPANLSACEVKIMDLAGVQYYSKFIASTKASIELWHNLPAGSYILHIEGDRFRKSEIFVVQNAK